MFFVVLTVISNVFGEELILAVITHKMGTREQEYRPFGIDVPLNTRTRN